MDKIKFVKFSTVALFLILIFVVINILIWKNINNPVKIIEDSYTYYLIGVKYASEGEFIKAEELFKENLSIDEFDNLSKTALETLSDFNDGIINKEYSRCFFKGISYIENKQYPQAIKEFQNAITINPNYFKAYNCIGYVYHLLHNSDEAISYYKKAVQINPDYIVAHNNLGGEYFSLRQYEQAITYVEKSVRINPSDAQSYYNLGMAYFYLKDPQKSDENFKKAKELYTQQKNYIKVKIIEATIKKLASNQEKN